MNERVDPLPIIFNSSLPKTPPSDEVQQSFICYAQELGRNHKLKLYPDLLCCVREYPEEPEERKNIIRSYYQIPEAPLPSPDDKTALWKTWNPLLTAKAEFVYRNQAFSPQEALRTYGVLDDRSANSSFSIYFPRYSTFGSLLSEELKLRLFPPGRISLEVSYENGDQTELGVSLVPYNIKLSDPKRSILSTPPLMSFELSHREKEGLLFGQSYGVLHTTETYHNLYDKGVVVMTGHSEYEGSSADVIAKFVYDPKTEVIIIGVAEQGIETKDLISIRRKLKHEELTETLFPAAEFIDPFLTLPESDKKWLDFDLRTLGINWAGLR